MSEPHQAHSWQSRSLIDIARIKELEEQLEAWRALSTRQDAFIRYLRPDLDASRPTADYLVKRYNALSNPVSEPSTFYGSGKVWTAKPS